MTTTTKVLLHSTLILSLFLALPASGYSHEGDLDAYGCHQDKEQKNYHCHEGVFKGGSFPSKIEMIRLLKIQFTNLGRPWPYGPVAEEDITAPPPEIQQ
jgi:hypothetical protein